MKTLHTDRPPANINPADIQVPAAEFMEKMKQQPVDIGPAPAAPVQQPAKKSKAWVWVLVIIILVVAALTIKAYLDRKKQMQNG